MQIRSDTRACAAIVLGLAAAVVPALAASAHNYAVSSIPAAGSTLTELPPKFVVTTNEDLLDLGGASKGFAIEIVDAVGKYYGDGCVVVSGASMSTTAAVGPAGAYTMIWQGVSIDGHIASAKIPFTWQPASVGSATTGAATPPVCGVVNPEASPALPSPGAAASTIPLVSETPSPSTSAVPVEDSAGGEAARAANSANTLLSVASLIAAGLVAAIAVILTRRRSARTQESGAPDGQD